MISCSDMSFVQRRIFFASCNAASLFDGYHVRSLLRSVRDDRGGNSGSNTSGSTVDVGVGGGMYDDGYSQPVMAPLSSVEWSHEEVLRLGRCELPQPREWTLADIGKEVRKVVWYLFVRFNRPHPGGVYVTVKAEVQLDIWKSPP